MIKKITTILLIITMVFGLTGCQLARENMGEKRSDKLIGIYVSYGSIDLSDAEGYLKDNVNGMNGEVIIDDSNQYQERMYATRKGEKYTETEFIFEDVEGIGMFSPTVRGPYNNESYTFVSGGDYISDADENISSGENENGVKLKGTIYVLPKTMEESLHFNPVYQTEDGMVYLMVGSGVLGNEENGEGQAWTHSLNEKITVNENGKQMTYTADIEVTVETMNKTDNISVIQMDKYSNVLKRNDYKPEDVPKEILPENETDYIILECSKLENNDEIKIERTVFSKSDDELWYFLTEDNKAFKKHYTNILWQK